MRHLDLFSGIGGFALAADWTWPRVEHIFCEIDPFCQKVLSKHWPESKIYEDIKQLDGKALGAIDLLTGGFPCQPYSNAGKRKGTEDDRNLWPEMFRVIRGVHPKYVIGENVDGLITWNRGVVLENLLSDLEGEGYEAQCFVIPACAVEAPHRRDRVWIVAHANGSGHIHGKTQKHPAKARESALRKSIAGSADVSDPEGTGGQRGKGQGGYRAQPQERVPRRHLATSGAEWWGTEPDVGRVAHGVPARLDRLKSLGNAIVPQVPYEIMKSLS